MEMTDRNVQEQAVNELLRYEKKNLRINRIKLICALICAVLCVALAVTVAINIRTVVKTAEDASAVLTEAGDSINEVADSLKEIDFEALSASVQSFADAGTETVEQIKTATEGLETMLEDVHDSIQRIGSVDIEDLNNGIQTLNSILEPLAKMFNISH